MIKEILRKIFVNIKVFAKSDIGIKITAILIKLYKFLHLRLVVTLCVIYFVLNAVIVNTLFKSIEKNVNTESVLSKVQNAIKEGKETVLTITKVIKAIGIDNMPVHVNTKLSNESGGTIIVVKREDKPTQDFLKNGRFIPLCGANINANIEAFNGKGESFFKSDIDFKLGDFTLPLGLEKAMHKMTTKFQYDAIIPISELFFLNKPSQEIENLKPKINSELVSYSIIFNEIDKSFQIGDFEPRIFYIARGFGENVVCNSSIQARIRVTNLDGSVFVPEFEHTINIGEGYIPYGLEHIMMRLRAGDKISVMLNKDWLKEDKKVKHKLTFLSNKQDYLIFDIGIMDVKQPMILFNAVKTDQEKNRIDLKRIAESAKRSSSN
ncbi:hypothetical protein [Candidatus Deianiraea vastatrix]|uniref:Uncharacterized protein n=1 Tax=Candidatus Deianiraea vastatrix TaxID=2163644 RepID=A0A5B8XGA3_9RICK|nr:hypothetical protein [Candidatus Deianiraea vastatrix]QED23344.1 hypothetical protein Deia_00549 [Candidatus Deianiraea vastatrix]